MKKVIRLAAIALAAMALTTACNNNAEEATDTMPVDTIDTIDTIEEVVEDTTPIVDVTPAPATKKAAAKPAAKKEEPKVTINTDPAAQGDKSGLTINTKKGSLTATKGENGLKTDVKVK